MREVHGITFSIVAILRASFFCLAPYTIIDLQPAIRLSELLYKKKKEQESKPETPLNFRIFFIKRNYFRDSLCHLKFIGSLFLGKRTGGER